MISKMPVSAYNCVLSCPFFISHLVFVCEVSTANIVHDERRILQYLHLYVSEFISGYLDENNRTLSTGLTDPDALFLVLLRSSIVSGHKCCS